MPGKPNPKPPADTRGATLRVILIRHGKAQRHADSGRDEDRRLKPRGERQAKWLGKTLADQHLTPSALLHSPVHRAVQTAARLAEQLDCDATEADALNLGSPARAVIDLIKKRGSAGVLALVGHNPQLEEVAAILVPQLRKNGVDLRTGEALVIEVAGDMTEGALAARLRLEDDEED